MPLKLREVVKNAVFVCGGIPLQDDFHNFLGNAGHFDGEVSPLRYLEMAAEWFATAIKLSPKRADLHFQLGQVLEEQHYVQDLYGIKPPVSWLVLPCI